MNDDPGGIALDELTTELTAPADPARPIRLIAIGLGPHVDLSVLRRMVQPSDGAAYQATTRDELKTVLFDALARRRPGG